MHNPVRILTHKSQRKLTDAQAVSLLTEYVGTDTTYKVLSEKYGIKPAAISKIVRGLCYRELPCTASLREEAQKKACIRYTKYSNAQAVRATDPSKTVIEVDFNSVESVDVAILRLQAVRSLIGPGGEVSL